MIKSLPRHEFDGEQKTHHQGKKNMFKGNKDHKYNISHRLNIHYPLLSNKPPRLFSSKSGDTAPVIIADHSLCPLTGKKRTKLFFLKIDSLGQSRRRAIIYSLKCKVEHVWWYHSCCTRMSWKLPCFPTTHTHTTSRDVFTAVCLHGRQPMQIAQLHFHLSARVIADSHGKKA